MNPLQRVQAALHGQRTDWLTLVDVLHDTDDPDVLAFVQQHIQRGRYPRAQATEDRWVASMEFERIHNPWRPAAALEADFDAVVSPRRMGGLDQQPEGWWLVAVIPLLLPLPSVAAIAVASLDHGPGVATTPWQIGRNGLRFSLLPPGHRIPYVIYDIAETHAFVELTFIPFLDIAPAALEGEDYPDPVHADLDRLSEDELHTLEDLHTGSRIGGWRVFNAEFLLDGTTCERCGQPLGYAAHLASDLFNDTFGEAGSVHIFICPQGCGARGMVDGA